MTKLDRVEAVDFIDQSFPDGTTEHVKGMRRNREKRSAAALPQFTDIVKISQPFHVLGRDV